MKSRRLIQLAKKPIAIALVSVVSLGLFGCGGEASKTDAQGNIKIKVNTPQDIAQESADNYDDNVNGVITGKTLKSWINDWEANRPSGIKGKLVILQQTQGPADYEFIKPNNTNVFTYLESGWRQPRSNGVTEIAGIVINGQNTDALIRKYGIDVKNDLIVCAQGTGGNSAMDQGRCWYTFRYWGVDAKNLAILDGGNNHLNGVWTAEDFTKVPFNGALKHPSPIINKQISSVKDLGVDNTALQATLEDLINVLPTHDENNLRDGVFLWDGRSLEQFSAGEESEAGGTLTNRYASFQNNSPRQSHPRGSVHLNWVNFIDTRTGLFKTKAEMKAYLDGHVDSFGKGFVDGTYQHLGLGNAYQKGDVVYLWCETSARAAVTQIASAVVLGLPTRLYDAAMIEWNSLMAGAVDKNGDLILDKNSPWDTTVLSAPYFPNKAELINPRDAEKTPSAPRIVDGFAPHSNVVIEEDKAYLRPQAASSSSTGGSTGGGNSGGGGVTLPSNPCGG
jgi:3-mercaptopyruvate sulfurtransferase SseA